MSGENRWRLNSLVVFAIRLRSAEGVSPEGNKFINENIATSVFRKSKDGKWRLIIDNSFGAEVLSV